MTHANTTPTSHEAACISRGWTQARQWLAGVLALAGLVAGAWPQALPLGRPVRLHVLRKVRYLEALMRRLTLAMAAQADWPDLAPRHARDRAANGPTGRPPQSQRIVFTLQGLGLARHWSPEPAPPPAPEPAATAALPPRKPIPPTIRLAEAWPDLSGVILHGRPVAVRPGQGPRIRSFDQPFTPQAPCETERSDTDGARLLQRIRALEAVAADPSRMVRRMARWLARRSPRGRPDHRPTPLCIGMPRLGGDAEDRSILASVQSAARDMIWRCDTS